MGRKKNRAARKGFSVDALEERRLLSGAFAGGDDNAIAYDSTSGNLYVAWYDGTLKSNYKDSAGNWHTTVEIDGTSGFGEYVSMALDSGGLPGVAYYASGASDLRFSRATIVSGALQWSAAESPDPDGTSSPTYPDGISVGLYPSLAFNAQSRPSIAYYDATHSSLRFVQRGSSSWVSPVQVENSADVGRYSSLKLNPNTGDWAIAYEKTGTGSVGSGGALYVERTTSGGVSTWGTPVSVASNRLGGGYTSLQYINSLASMSFYDAYDANLMFARKASTTGSTWQTAVSVAANNIQGRYTNLLVQGATGSQKARIVFQDYNSVGSTGPQTVRVADEPADWRNDAWDISNRLTTGGGPEIKAARVSDTEFYYTRVGENPTNPTLIVSNSVNEGKNYVAKTTSAFSAGDVYGHASVVFAEPSAPTIDEMWVIGGLAGSSYTNNVYSSPDGQNWTQRTSTTGTFTARIEHAAVVRNGTIYVIGGDAGSALVSGNDMVYSSTNGVDWQQVVTTHALPSRREHTAVVMGSDIYVIGGYGIAADGSGPKLLDEVWKFDGTDWSQVTPGGGARFSPRKGLASYVYNGNLWVVAGYVNPVNGGRTNDVWMSSDGGSTWTSQTLALAFPNRSHASYAVFDNRMWILGGRDSGDFDSVYWSTDGKTWTRADPGSQFAARREHTSLVFNNRLWVIGGAGAIGSNAGQSVYYAKNGE